MAAIKKACGGTSLYPKSSSVSSKLKAGGKIKKAQTGKKLTVDDILGTSAERAENSRKVDSIISSRTKELKNPKPKNSNEYTNTPEFRKLFSESAERSNRAAKQAANSIPTKANGGLRKNGGNVAKAKDGKWMQKVSASIKRRGTEGKCTPITKPGCTGKAKALAKTFKKIAKSNKKK
jgi:hypothetical protein